MRRLDNKRELVDYFKKNLSKNYTTDTLKFALINQGYSRAMIDQAIEQANEEMANTAPKLPKEKPVIKYEIYDMNNKPLNIEPMGFWEKLWNRVKGNRV